MYANEVTEVPGSVRVVPVPLPLYALPFPNHLWSPVYCAAGEGVGRCLVTTWISNRLVPDAAAGSTDRAVHSS